MTIFSSSDLNTSDLLVKVMQEVVSTSKKAQFVYRTITSLSLTSKKMYGFFNDITVVNFLFKAMSDKFKQPKEEFAAELNTIGARQWLLHYIRIRGDDIAHRKIYRLTFEVSNLAREMGLFCYNNPNYFLKPVITSSLRQTNHENFLNFSNNRGGNISLETPFGIVEVLNSRNVPNIKPLMDKILTQSQRVEKRETLTPSLLRSSLVIHRVFEINDRLAFGKDPCYISGQLNNVLEVDVAIRSLLVSLAFESTKIGRRRNWKTLNIDRLLDSPFKYEKMGAILQSIEVYQHSSLTPVALLFEGVGRGRKQHTFKIYTKISATTYHENSVYFTDSLVRVRLNWNFLQTRVESKNCHLYKPIGTLFKTEVKLVRALVSAFGISHAVHVQFDNKGGAPGLHLRVKKDYFERVKSLLMIV